MKTSTYTAWERPVEQLMEPEEGFMYGFRTVAWTTSGQVHTHTTSRMEHSEFLQNLDSAKQVKDYITDIMKNSDLTGVVTVGETTIRLSAVEAFAVQAIAYEPIDR